MNLNCKFIFVYFFSYAGASESLDGSIALSYGEDEGATGPMFYFFKDALKEVKC